MDKNKFKSEKKISNIKYMKYKSVELWNNSKIPKGRWKKDDSCITDLCLHKYYERNCNSNNPRNFSLLTGKKNNISVVDIDCNKDENIHDNIFIKKFGADPKKWNEDLGAFVVGTPSGGFHLYFQYEETLKQGQDEESHIDIRNDGGLILAPGCIRDGKTYTILAGDTEKINKIPDEVRDFIHSIEYYNPNKNDNKIKKTRVKKIKDKDGKNEIIIEEIIGCDQSLYEYNYPDDLIRNIIEGLDQKKYFMSYTGWLIFSTAMKQIGRKDLWEEYSEAMSSKVYDEDKNEMIWNGITGHKTMYAINHLLLNTSYEKARTSLDYFKLKPILKNKIQSTTKINRKKLGYEYFKELVKTDKKFFIIKSDTGTGKTTTFRSLMNDRQFKKNNKFISIVSRVSLGLEQYETFNEEGIWCEWYENSGYEPDNRIGYVIQVDSLMKLKYWCDVGATSGCVLFMDEFNSIVKHLFTSETLVKNGIRIPIMDLLVDLIREAKYVFMTDADISDQSLKFLDFILDYTDRYDDSVPLKDKFVFIENEYKHNSGRPAEELFNIENMIEMMKKTKKWICPCDEARSCHLLKEQIGDPNIIIIDSNVNKRYNWDEHDRIIFSPKVIYGLDSVMERPVFCFYQETTIDPKDMLQQINRNRNITKLYYLFQRKKCKNTDFNTLADAIDDTNNLKKWCEKNDHLHQEISRVHPIFQEVFNELKYNQDCYKSNPYAHFKKLLIERGFNDKTNIHQSIRQNTRQMLKVDKERMIESIHKDLPYVKEKNEYIGLPEEEIKNHKEIFCDRNFIGHFIGLKTYIFDKMGQTYNLQEKKWVDEYTDELTRLQDWNMKNKDKLFKSEEFNIKKIKTNINKMLYMEKLRNDIGINDRLKITDFNLLSNEKADEYHEEYKAIFTDRSTKEKENPLYTEYGTQRFIGMLYKKTFGINPFPEQSTSENGKTIRKFMDAELKDFNVFNVVYEKAKNKKINDLEKEECDALKKKFHSGECLLD
jgi:hypothetical protein